MIRICYVERDAIPRVVEASGHAFVGLDGESAACAAVSVALKALGLTLVEKQSCRVDGEISKAGDYRLEIASCRDKRWLQGVWSVTLRLLEEARRTWPDEITIDSEKEK